MKLDVNIKKCGKTHVIIEFLSDEAVRWAGNFVDTDNAEWIDGCLKLHKKYLDHFFMGVEELELVVSSEDEEIMNHSTQMLEV